ncbi:PilC/PilY family type IV pilus protein [Acinetobacter sp. YH12136]|uniref:PilC/PilY family type IV pilus protein n=1 Tax=Acinetobacter sp. YH12136 TaxID=2601120 RepID=UPI0015D24C11|nr:PilC/PilY family type IV pilus protein [Acinetobacter sp. YH12136]
MKQQINYFLGSCRYKVLAASVAAVSTALITTSVTQASDIEIYQDAKSGTVTLMFVLDISGSMVQNKDGFTQNRMERVKVAMKDVLLGSSTVKKIDDDKVVGLSTLPYFTGYNNTEKRTQVVIPARRLDAKVTVGGNQITQRELLNNTIQGLQRQSGTPTANAYAETAAYLFGEKTIGEPQTLNLDNKLRYRSYHSSSSGRWYQECVVYDANHNCTSWSKRQSTPIARATGTGDEYTCTFTDEGYQRKDQKCWNFKGELTITDTPSGSGFDIASSDTKVSGGVKYESPTSLTQTDEQKVCSGQGIYLLTDGEPNNGDQAGSMMKLALGSKASDFSCSESGSGWDCMHKFSQNLLDASRNPKNIKFKTAIVGFGSGFNNVTSYDPRKTQAENISALGFINTDVKKAAYLGIIGEGGWYSGNSSQDVVDSVNAFISNLSKDIPSVTTGSPTVPRDALNPAELQDDAYYQTFQPTPNTNYQLWVGNLKKYKVGVGGVLKGRNNADVFNDNGSLVEPTYDDNGNITNATYDFWSKAIDNAVATSDENTVGSRKFAARGGAWSQLLLGAKTDNQTPQRKLLTNRKAVGSGASVVFGGSSDLRQVQLSDLTDSPYKDDPNRGHLVSLLGYNIDVDSPPTSISNLIAQPTLRQVGAVMHSYPVLVTNKGKLSYNSTAKLMESTNREDYILFGTTQGLLHVVDANTGVEKFAFVPDEMVSNQKDAFRLSSVTTGGLQKMFYGIDGPWTLDTRYVVDNSGALTVGAGRTSKQKGWQIAYGGLRMGGRSYYALDLSDIDTPALKFHIDPATQKVYSGSSSKTFSQLQYMGQSWSKPSIAWVNWGGVRKRVMFVGGGYDAGGVDGDARDSSRVKGIYGGYENHDYNQSNQKGAGVYMFDADDGDLLWWASNNAPETSATTVAEGVITTKHSNLQYSVTSQIRTVDRDGDELIDHIYFGDLGGQLFRIDFDNKQNVIGAVPQTPVRLLDLNAAEKSPRFYDMPSFSLYSSSGETFALISIGSGNRSQPLQDFSAADSSYDYDAIYNIYDKDVARRDLFTRTITATDTGLNTENITKSQLGEITDSNRFSTATSVAPYSAKGWYYQFQNCTAGVKQYDQEGKLIPTKCDLYKKQSEKVFGTPLAMNRKLYVSTFDASKPGISGDCGAGVKGESMITAFCLPYGQCKDTLTEARGVIGVGIHTVTVGGLDNSNSGDDNDECVGEDCPPKDCEGEACPPIAIGDTSAKNYCIETSGRIALTVTGGFGSGEQTKMCLIPQRWYEKLSSSN